MFKKFLSKTGMKKDEFDELEGEEEYLELDTARTSQESQKVIVRPFVLEDFVQVKPILDTLREGKTICLVNIKPLREKDIVELKRAINKLKKTCHAMSGDVAGFGEDYIVVTPSFAEIYRNSATDELDE